MFGLCLFMDGYNLPTSSPQEGLNLLSLLPRNDSHIYHESLVQPAMMAAMAVDSPGASPKKVLIGGGGELVTAYEVLKWASSSSRPGSSVGRVDMVDIDDAVVKMAKERLKKFHFDCYEDERLRLCRRTKASLQEEDFMQTSPGESRQKNPTPGDSPRGGA